MIQIIPATENHVDSIIALWQKLMLIHQKLESSYFSNVTDESSIKKYKNLVKQNLKDKDHKILIAVDNGDVIGYVTAQLCQSSQYNDSLYCELEDIMIDTDYQNSGVGKQLIEEVKKWAGENLAITIRLNVFSKNEEAFVFFEKQNFRPLFNQLEFKLNSDAQ
jgi:ribosomal protein S18 acetylase RimI-like enzyme